MGFILLLILTTFSIAGSAAFFSIYGLAQIFTGSFWPVVIMASSLEAGKLVAASYVYRYWKRIKWTMKMYLLTAILVLMLITSAGIFGFLSQAYQQDILPLNLMEQKITLITEEKGEIQQLKQERLERKRQIDTDIAKLPNNYITGRQRLMKSYGPELQQLKIDIAEYTKYLSEKTLEIQKLKNEIVQEKVHTGPIIFIAAAFDRKVDDATKWLILLIIFVFDPLAVALTIATNMVILDRSGKKPFPEINNSSNETTADELFEQPTSHITTDEIRQVIEEMDERKGKLTPAEMAQKGMLEEMLKRKDVQARIRNPQKQ